MEVRVSLDPLGLSSLVLRFEACAFFCKTTKKLFVKSSLPCWQRPDMNACLDILRTEEVDVVICGIMEWLDGKEFERMLNTFPGVPVIVCSASPRKAALPALQAGAYDFLQKPFEPEQLISMVE